MGSTFYVASSGGLDSTVLLSQLVAMEADVRPIFFSYGSTHEEYEYKSFQEVCNKLFLWHQRIPILSVFDSSKSALLLKNGRDIPTGKRGYNEEGSLEATVVPGRNLVMAASLSALAEAEAIRTGKPCFIAMGVHASDHALYPDCRPGFVYRLADTIQASTQGRVTLVTPFLHLTKADIVKIGLQLDAPMHLTRSCYAHQGISCGVCGTCRERLAAFAENGVKDPIPYGGMNG